MCGIFAYLGKKMTKEQLRPYAMRIKHRGPDNTKYESPQDYSHFWFHRLAINGLDAGSDQPLHHNGMTLICNGEIYNCNQLGERYGFNFQTNSDCEVILHMFEKFGIHDTVKQLDGVFAFVLYDGQDFWAARDHLGIRAMYIGFSYDSESSYPHIGIASEAKALTFMENVQQFPAATWWCWNAPNSFMHHYHFQYPIIQRSENEILAGIKHYLTEAVRKRYELADVEVGCLLSGGLDSSLVSAICQDISEVPIKTFSIGLPGSPDLKAAKEVAEFLGTDHYSVTCTEQDFLDAVEDTIYTLGSFDVTTIRASVGHRLISLYVADNSDVKVLFSGETADEFGSYLYFQNAPSPEAFQTEAIRLLKDIHFFDGLRSDRSISCAGLEARVPFSDKDFMAFYMSIDPKLRAFDSTRMEKYLIRKAFEGYLPDSVLWRRKNGFSDSVSDITRSWSIIVGEWIDTLVTDEEFEERKNDYEHDPPQIKEAYFYRKIYEKHYGHHELTPYQWLPKWCGDVTDPSARVLDMYQAD